MGRKNQNENHLYAKSTVRYVFKKSKWWVVLLVVAALAPLATLPMTSNAVSIPGNSWYQFLLLTFLVGLAISVCQSLTDVLSLRKNENGITWCQIFILIAGAMWLVGMFVIFKIYDNPMSVVLLGVLGTLLGWIFQDIIKGIVSFIHLRINNLLSIDDWIKVPKYNVDGRVVHVTLTTVTICNWDTTTSSVPTSALYSDHFINLQKMTEGRTHGRLMTKTFLLDTNWFHPLSAAEAETLSHRDEVRKYLTGEDIREGVLNARLFRLYLYHWMMGNPHISQMPCLVVRWLEQKESGMPLQVYAFIMEGSFSAYEWQQSQIIEHIIDSLTWFGLQLYQNPSSFDVCNCNVHLTDQKSTYIKELFS